MHLHKQPSPFSLAPVVDLDCVVSDDARGCVQFENDREVIQVRALENGVFEIRANYYDDPLEDYAPPLAEVPAVCDDVEIEQDEDGGLRRFMRVGRCCGSG